MVRYTPGPAFDVGRISDIDIAIVDKGLFQRAKSSGIGIRGGGVRTDPFDKEHLSNLESIGLKGLWDSLRQKYGRDFNFMIYENADDAIQRMPSVEVM